MKGRARVGDHNRGRRQQVAEYLAHCLKSVVTKIRSVSAGSVSPAQQYSQLISICCLAEFLLPGFPHRSNCTWDHCWHFGCMSWSLFSLMPEPLHLPHPCPCTAALLPVFCHSLVVPGLRAHTLLSSGISLRSGGSIGGDTNSPVGSSDFILLPWVFQTLGSFRSAQAVPIYFEEREKFLSFQVRVFTGFSEVIYEYKSQPTYSS